MIDINPDRLLTHLSALGKIGAVDHGVDRAAFSEVDASARQWVSERFEEAGFMLPSIGLERELAAAVDELISARSNVE